MQHWQEDYLSCKAVGKSSRDQEILLIMKGYQIPSITFLVQENPPNTKKCQNNKL